MTLPRSEAEFERQFTAASRRGVQRRQNQPLATSVSYDPNWGVRIELNNGCLVCVPLRLLPELAGASRKDLRRVQLLGAGQAIEWPTLDQQFDVLQLVADAVGAQALMAKLGQRGGPVKSRAKAGAACQRPQGRPASQASLSHRPLHQARPGRRVGEIVRIPRRSRSFRYGEERGRELLRQTA